MKKIFTILLTGLVFFAINGCDGSNDDDDDHHEENPIITEVATSNLHSGYSVTYNSENDDGESYSTIKMDYCNINVNISAGDTSDDVVPVLGEKAFTASGDIITLYNPDDGRSFELITSGGAFTVGTLVTFGGVGDMTVTSIDKINCGDDDHDEDHPH